MAGEKREQLHIAREVMERRAKALRVLAGHDRDAVSAAADAIMEKDRVLLAELARQ